MSKKIVIAIDGPAGSGKSTVAKYLAQKLGFNYVDTGAMYRAITYEAIKKGITENSEDVVKLVKELDIQLQFENGLTRVFVNDDEITDFIRTAEVNSKVSEISVIPEVRSELVRIQKRIGGDCNIVAEGRDTTTVVFPDADLKIYLTASLDERARRRHKEYIENGTDINIEQVKENIKKRDNIDSGREISPLRKADDAIEIDNSNTSIEKEIELLLEKINKIINK